VTARPILLLHGALGAAAQLAPLGAALRALAGGALAVHAIDFEGHGAAAPSGRPYRTAGFVDNVRDALDRLGIDRAPIFGYSMGGYVALALAAAEPALAARHAAAGGWEGVLERTREMMHALGARPDLDDETLRGLAVPARVAVGDRDATVGVEESAAVVRLLAEGELEVLPRTPHPLEKVPMERLARSILEFAATPRPAVA
jgi:pimeloyl-ACP methyl ester carboxylesterase